MKLLFIGDIVGKPGRACVRRLLPGLVDAHEIDLVIANVENAAGGSGITRETAQEIIAAGVEVMTTGNHVWDKREALDYIANEPRLIRPINYTAGAPGHGSCVAETARGIRVGVVNAMGRVYMPLTDDPFAIVPREVERLRREASVVLVDFHAEVTSEKMAMGWRLNGLATAVVGTHTHVQTADERVLPRGTAYITDVGMTGPYDSIIGVDVEAALARFVTGLPSRFDTAKGEARMHAVVVDADESTGLARSISRMSLAANELPTGSDLEFRVPL